MIIGNGDIASALVTVDKESLMFFASGVSNSKETREEEYEREKLLLMENFHQYPSRHIVYFSSLCVFYSQNRYARHKREMERIIRETFGTYTIVRLGNITWGDNPHTIINFVRSQIKKGESFPIINTWRYILDKDEFIHWVQMIPPWNCEMNITGRKMLVSEIVKEYGNDK